jgi:predicted transcriptional regulator
MQTLTCKVSAETTRWLDEEARKQGRPKSAIVREALESLRRGAMGASALEAAGDAVGRVASTRRDLGSNPKHLRGFGR